jgi:hypothetical protein
MHSFATVIVPLYEGIIFVGTFNGAELVRWFSEIAQTLDAITGSQSWMPRWSVERWLLGAL